tara:strand:+ start:1898 stop:2665 length:768 start_codon:yes stop_codon:yes gene_type:complete
MIPVLGTAIVNGPHWLKRQIESIDFPVENYVIFNNNGKGEITNDLEILKLIKNPNIKNIFICHLPANIGVSGAWNLIIKSYINSPYWIIVNHDVSFTPGILEEMWNKAENKETGMVFGKRGDFNLGGFDLFLIKDWVVQKLGLFDENFYPAYCEDADYIMKVHNNNIPKDFCELLYYHGESTEYYETGSQTKKEDPYLYDRLEEVNLINFEYMNEKWGPDWRTVWPYKKPFNMKELPDTYNSYNLEFARKKYLGF